MSMKSQILSMSFRTPGRVDVEPPSVANNLRECAAASPRAWQAAADADVVDNIEDEVVEILLFGLSEQFIADLFSFFLSLRHVKILT
jgi:hypothetical protein